MCEHRTQRSQQKHPIIFWVQGIEIGYCNPEWVQPIQRTQNPKNRYNKYINNAGHPFFYQQIPNWCFPFAVYVNLTQKNMGKVLLQDIVDWTVWSFYKLSWNCVVPSGAWGIPEGRGWCKAFSLQCVLLEILWNEMQDAKVLTNYGSFILFYFFPKAQINILWVIQEWCTWQLLLFHHAIM